jgi:hypothetical protein
MGQIIEADEIGCLVLTTSLLRKVRPYSQYRVEVIEDKILLEPVPAADQSKVDSDEWTRQWKVVQQQVGESWPSGVSAAEVISEMRR